MTIKIYSIWVGQGDCTLIQTDANKLILIDCGTADSQSIYEDNVGPTIKKIMDDLGKTSIDLLILTHSDKDHCNLVARLFDFTTFELAYFGGSPFQYTSFGLKLEQKDHNPQIKKIVALASSYFNILNTTVMDDGDFKLYIVSGNYPFSSEPPDIPVDKDVNRKRSRNKAERSVYDNNGNSLIVVMSYNGFLAFFMGDATVHQQDVLYAKAVDSKSVGAFKADMMKMAHHGSLDSLCEDLTNKAIKPPVVTASAGVTFGHPSQQAIQNIGALRKAGANEHKVVEYNDSDQKYFVIPKSVEYLFNTMQNYNESVTIVPTHTTTGKKSRDPHAGEPYLEMHGGNWLFEISGPGVVNGTSPNTARILTTKSVEAVTAKKKRRTGGDDGELIRLVSNARFVGGRWVSPDK